MTINKVANQDDVKYRSGLLGWEGTLFRQLPDKTGTATTGSGSVGVSDFATTISPGATTGDTAQLQGWYAFGHGGHVSKATVELVYYLRSSTPYTDDFELGWCKDAVGSNMAMYLDVTAGEYHVGTSTTAATLPSSTNQPAHLVIEADYDAGETTFTQTGAVNETATITETPSAQGALGAGLIVSNSNGSGDSLRATYARQTVEF